MIQPEDFTISNSGSLGSRYSVSVAEGCSLGQFDSLEEAETAIRERMNRDQFWPSVWFINDHGNIDAHQLGEDL